MKIGMNLLLWTTHVTSAHDPLLADLRRTGYDGVEIPIFEGTSADYRTLGAKLRDLGLGTTAVTVMSPDASPISPDAKARAAAVDRLRWVLDRAAECGAEVLCGPLHSPLGVFSGVPATADENARGVETLRTVADHAAAHGITLAIEYLNRFENYFLTTAADNLRLVAAVNHPACGCMWDTFHAHIEEKNPAAALAALRGHLVHVHLSENDRGTPGTGQVNWRATFDTLRAIGYDRWLVIEAFGRALPELAAATRVWRDLFADPRDVYTAGLAFIRENLAR
ncbi:sugar phosphate isomerase/epimerase family protein [Horticoccus luteus]